MGKKLSPTIVRLLNLVSQPVDAHREVRLYWRPIVWLLGRARNPLHPQAVRLVDIRAGDTVIVNHRGNDERQITFTGSPFLSFKYWLMDDEDKWKFTWQVDARWHYLGRDYVFNKPESLSDMGISRSFPRPYIGQQQWFTPYRYALRLLQDMSD